MLFKLMGNFEAMKIHTESKTFTALCSFIFSFSLKFISLKFLIQLDHPQALGYFS